MMCPSPLRQGCWRWDASCSVCVAADKMSVMRAGEGGAMDGRSAAVRTNGAPGRAQHPTGRMTLMSPRKTILAATAAVMLLGARAFGALLVGDGNAMAGWNGTVNFDMTVATLILKAEV